MLVIVSITSVFVSYALLYETLLNKLLVMDIYLRSK
jgi:hypothetical protein